MHGSGRMHGEAERGAVVNTRCKMCRQRYERKLLRAQDGHCRPCQIIRAKTSKDPKHDGVLDRNLRCREEAAAFDEYDVDKDQMLNEQDLTNMVTQLRHGEGDTAVTEIVEEVSRSFYTI